MAELGSKQWSGQTSVLPPQLQTVSIFRNDCKSIEQTPVTRGHMHHQPGRRARSPSRHAHLPADICGTILTKKSFQRPSQTSESFLLVLKLNFSVTLSCCYRSSKSHFLHHRHCEIVCWPHTLEGDRGGRRDRYIWTIPCYPRIHAHTSARPDSQVLN